MATDQENTARIFRTAYLIAKNQCPYTDKTYRSPRIKWTWYGKNTSD